MSATENLRKVILNGDDFGFTGGVNRGIIESLKNGILTSTSVMVNRPNAKEARELSKIKNISVGLHLDLTEENSLQRWSKILYILAWPEQRIRDEFKKQIDTFTNIVGRLPDHIDSHHHIHWITGFRNVVLEFSKENNIPVRCVDAKFQMGFYGRSLSHWNDPKGVSPERLINVIKNLPAGVHEIMCHPGFVDKDLIETKSLYLNQRKDEVNALTNDSVKSFVANDPTIQLINWNDLK